MQAIKKLGDKEMKKEENIDDLLNLENNNDICSTQNISIENDITNINNTNTGKIDDDYDIDF